jgi:DNA topoisomerase-2
VHFIITAPGLGKMSDAEIEKSFKLRSKLGKSNMHLFDAEGRIKKYDTPEQIIEEFYPLRLKYYSKRKESLVDNVQREWKRLENQVRFILMVIKKELVVANRKKVDLLNELIEKKFDPMPKEKKKKVAGTVKRGNKTTNVEVEADEGDESDDEIEDGDNDAKNYDYLLSMPIWSLTMERVKKLQDQLNERKKELDELLSTSAEQFWEADLDAFLEKWEVSIVPIWITLLQVAII